MAYGVCKMYLVHANIGFVTMPKCASHTIGYMMEKSAYHHNGLKYPSKEIRNYWNFGPHIPLERLDGLIKKRYNKQAEFAAIIREPWERYVSGLNQARLRSTRPPKEEPEPDKWLDLDFLINNSLANNRNIHFVLQTRFL